MALRLQRKSPSEDEPRDRKKRPKCRKTAWIFILAVSHVPRWRNTPYISNCSEPLFTIANQYPAAVVGFLVGWRSECSNMVDLWILSDLGRIVKN